jgi:AraC-like DNA-binding protein
VDTWIRTLSDLNLAGAVHAFGQAAVLCLVRRGPRAANRILGAFLLALAAGMSHGTAARLGAYDRWPGLAILMATLPLLYGPLFFLYVRAITDPASRWRVVDTIHGIPLLLGVAAYAAAGSQSVGHAVRLTAAAPAIAPWHLVLALAAAQTAGYLVAIRTRLRRYETAIRDACSTVDLVTLGWLRWRIAAYGVIWTAGVVALAAVASDPPALVLVSQAVFFLVALNSFVTGYRSMVQPMFPAPERVQSSAARYARSSLTPEDAAGYEARLLSLMEREKPFLDPSLTLPALASALDVQSAHLSRVINERLGQNFFDFVNRYRVDAACERLGRPEAAGDKLIGVALASGFNSLATFNRVFKELTGRTPSAYRRGIVAQRMR